MFVGHFGLGFAGKWVARRSSLGTLFLAAQFIDLLWPTLLLLGLETVRVVPGITRVTPLDFVSYPISHSLLAVVGWALLFAGAYYLLRRSVRAALVCAVLVVSHWLLDFITHRPDLPLTMTGSHKVGLGLWDYPALAIGLELAVFAGGALLYARATRARDRAGSIGLWALLVFLSAVYVGNLFGAPPPGQQEIAWVSQAQWILIIWGYWLDRHREERDPVRVV